MELDGLPSFDQLSRLAPVTTIIIAMISYGYYLGYRAGAGEIRALREWIDDLRKK